MSKFVYKDGAVLIDAVDLAELTKNVQIQLAAASQDSTGLNFGGGSESLQGLKAEKIIITFMNDFDDGSVDATLFPLYDSGEAFDVSINAFEGSTSTSNPQYRGSCRLMNYDPINAAVGALSTTQVTFEVQGRMERVTT